MAGNGTGMPTAAGGVTRVRTRPKIHWSAYAYLSPAIISISVLSLLPMLYAMFISFTNFNALHFLSFQFVGLQNFRAIFDPTNPLYSVFVPTAIWTILFAFGTTTLNYVTGFFFAILLNNKNMKESTLYRSLLIIPWAVPSTISILAWQGLLNQSYGQIDGLLQSLGLPQIPWLLDPNWAKVSILMVNLWLGFPYMMTMILGALQAVPTELYEASAIDGANWWQQNRLITLPAIWRISLPPIIATFAYNFNNFGISYLLTTGGPPRSDNQFVGYTDILASAVYKMTNTFSRYDWAAAISMVLFVIVGVLSLIQMRLTGAFKEVDL